MASNAAGTDDLGQGVNLTGSERKGGPLVHVAAVANDIGGPLLSRSTATAEVAAQSRLSIGWGVPAPNWLLAFSSGAFFFLAFFAFCQYRRRVPRVHIRRKDDGAALSNSSPSSSDPAPPSLPDVSKEAVLRSVSISDARTSVQRFAGEAFRALHCSRHAGPPLPLCVAPVFTHRSNTTHMHRSSETSAAPCYTVPIVSSTFNRAYPSIPKRCAANLQATSLAASATTSAAATSAARGAAVHGAADRGAARGTFCASYSALPLGRMEAGDYHPSPSEMSCKGATGVANNSCATGSYADKVTASAIWRAALKTLSALPSAAPSISTSSVPSTVATPLPSNAGTTSAAAAMASASRSLSHPGEFAFAPSTDGDHISAEADWTWPLPHAATEGHAATMHLSSRLPSPQTDRDAQNEGIMRCVDANSNNNNSATAAVVHNPTAASYNIAPASRSTSFCTSTHEIGACPVFSNITPTNSAAIYHTSGATPAAPAATPAAACVTPAAAACVTPAAACVTPAAAATMPPGASAAAACHAAASRRSLIIFPPCSSLKDYCSVSPHFLFAREIVLHAAAPSGRRKVRSPSSGRDFSAHGAGPPDDVKKERSAALGKERRRRLSIQIPADVQITPKVETARGDGAKMKRGLAAAGARGGGAAAGLGHHTLPSVHGGDAPSPAPLPRDVRIGAGEIKSGEEEDEAQASYSMLAMNEEDLPMSSSYSGPLFIFDGASTRSWILAFVAVAALLRGLLLLLQLVANPLEISRYSLSVTVPLPAARSSFSVPVPLPPVYTPFLHAASASWPRDGMVAGGKQTSGKNISGDTVSIPSSAWNGNLSPLDASESISFSTHIDAPHTDGSASSISLRFTPEDYSLKRLSSSAGARPGNPQARDASSTPATGLFSNNRTPGDTVSVPAYLVQHSSSAHGGGAAAVPAGASESRSSDVASASSSDLAPTFSTKRLFAHAKSISSVKPAPPHAAAPQRLLSMELTEALPKKKRHLEGKTVAVASDETFAARNTPVNVSTPPAAFTAYSPKIPQNHRFATLSPAGKASVAASAPATAAASADFAQKYTLTNEGMIGQYAVVGNDMSNVHQPVAKGLDANVSKTSGQHGQASECSKKCVHSSSVACSSCDLPESSRKTESNSSNIDSSSTYALVTENWSNTGKISARIGFPANTHRSEISSKDGRHSRTETKCKTSGDSKPQRTRLSGKQRKKRRFHWKSRPTTTPPTSSPDSEGTNSPGRGRTRWPSARWLRTLARSLPPMLSLEAYAFLILFLMDLFYASSRLESMQWIAVGSYIFLGGVWVLFGCIAGLTVAEDSTRREAAHLFARSVCWLLGSCFTLLSVSLAVAGTFVLQQLRGRASTHLFFPPSMVLRHPHVVVDSSLRFAPAASNVYPLPGAGLFRWAAALVDGEGGSGGAAASAQTRPIAAWNDDPYRCAYTGRRHFYTRRPRKQLYDAAPASRSEALLSACRVGYRSPELVADSLEDFGDTSAPGTLAPAQYPGTFQRDTSCSRRPASSSAEREHMRIFEHGKPHTCARQAERRVGYRAQNRSSLFVLPMNFFHRAFFKVRENARRCSYGGEASGPACSTIAWRRLFMLTLCCPPLLLIRGVHMLLVGAQVFPHYYPSVIEEKDTLDVLLYLVTEWVPLTLLVCALSTTAASQRSRDSTVSHASLQECEDNSSLPTMHHLLLLRASQRLPQRPNNYGERSGASERPCCRPARKVESTFPAPVHLPSCPLYAPFSAATVCAGRAQPLDSEQRTVQKYCREVRKQYTMAGQSQSNLCNKQKVHSKTLGDTQCTDDWLRAT